MIPLVNQFVAASLAPRTKKTYDSVWQSYCNFCMANQLTIVPVAEANIIFFFTHLTTRHVSHRSLQVYLSALSYYSHMLGSPISTQHMHTLYHTMRGIKRTQGKSLIQERRNPITAQHMVLIKRYLESYIPINDGIMLFCACSFAFFGLMRSAEYVSPTKTTFNADTLLFTDVTLAPDHSMLFVNLRVSKTDPFRYGTRLHLFRINSDICPVQAAIQYFDIIPSVSGPMFQFQDGKFLTRHFITYLLHHALPSVHNINTHSFRIGGASAASSHGIPDSIIQILGRWSSDCFRQYIRMPDKDIAQYQSLLAVAPSEERIWDSNYLSSVED